MSRRSSRISSLAKGIKKGTKTVAKGAHSVVKGIGTVGAFVPVLGTVFRDKNLAYGFDRGSNETRRMFNESNAMSWNSKTLKEKASDTFWDARGALRSSRTLKRMKANNKKKAAAAVLREQERQAELKRYKRQLNRQAKENNWIQQTTYDDNNVNSKSNVSLDNVQQFLAPSKKDLSAKKIGQSWSKKAHTKSKTRNALARLQESIAQKKLNRKTTAKKLAKQYLKNRKIVDTCIVEAVDLFGRMPYKKAFEKFVHMPLHKGSINYTRLVQNCPNNYLKVLRRRQQYLDEQAKDKVNNMKVKKNISKCVSKFIDKSGKMPSKDAILKFIEKEDWSTKDIMKLKELCGDDFQAALEVRQNYLSNRKDFLSKNIRTQKKMVRDKEYWKRRERQNKTEAKRARKQRNTTGVDPREQTFYLGL